MLVSQECIKSTFHITGQRVIYDAVLVYRQPDFVQVHGSCFLIQWEGAKMIIMTNAHVTDNGRAFSVVSTLIPNQPLPATLRSFVPNRDLSLVEVNTALLAPDIASLLKTIKPVVFATEINMKIGEQVAVIGFPLATRNIQTSQGVITGHESPGSHNAMYSSYTDRQYFQTDAAINAGNSGGPVINVRNEVVGVASAGINTSINFVIPAYVVTSVLSTMLKHAFIYMPTIGIVLQPSPLGAIITKIYSHSIFCRTNWTYEAQSMTSYAKQVAAKSVLEGSGKTPARVKKDAATLVASLFPHSTPVVTHSELNLFDVVEGITIINNGTKLEYHIDDHGLVKDEGFLMGAFLTEINDMIDYGTDVTLYIVRANTERLSITVRYVTSAIVAQMARPAYITIEPSRFDYLFQYGLLLRERAHEWQSGDSLLMGVAVSAVLRTSIADTYSATQEDAMITTFNNIRIYTLAQFLECVDSLHRDATVTIKFDHGTYLIATSKQLKEDDNRLLALYNIPARGRIMSINR